MNSLLERPLALAAGRIKAFRGLLARLGRDQGGAVVVITGLAMPVLVGAAGLSMDVAAWYMVDRRLQGAADSAAMEAAHLAIAGADIDSGVAQFLSDNNLLDSRTSLSVNVPPRFGAHQGVDNHYEVRLTRPAPLYFTAVLGDMFGWTDSVNADGRGVSARLGLGDQCVVALDTREEGAIFLSGNADVSASCGVASNSSNDLSILLFGSARLRAETVRSVGGIRAFGGGGIESENPVQPFSGRSGNPFASVPIPSDDGCDFSGGTFKDGETLTPGRYCGGLDFKGPVSLEPGLYVVDGGDLTANAKAAVTGEGVTFLLTGDTPEDVGTVTVNGKADLAFSAPDTGPWRGLAIMQDPKAPYRETRSRFNGGSGNRIKGALYFPSGDLRFAGGSTASDGCLRIFAATVTFTGGSTIGNDPDTCESLGLKDAAPSYAVYLVE
ncbi:pilus assembly protein TadG-related protein [Yunchengibacter salinarum]|uniref:pilus assembly protein TadG-related protein n=1 Tax=Yunchengibacter salinarum TaxID=3133399 RepID=UPI0035B5B492